MDPIPFPGSFYLTFQRQLEASAQIAHLANTTAHVHWLYEGWTGLPTPLGPELTRIYTRAACASVRSCSEVERHVAKNRAVRWGLRAFDALKEQMASCDTTPERAEDLVRTFIEQCLDVHRYALTHGADGLAPQERVLLHDLEAEEQ